jgi:hypothetical protein
MSEQTIEVLLLALGGVFTALSAVGIAYARRAALAVAKATDAKLTEEQLAQLERYVSTAIAYVEERVHKYLRGLVQDAPKSGAEKQQLAVQVARELAPDNLQKFSDKAIAVVVDAKVQDRRVSIPVPHLSIPPPSSYPPPATAPLIPPPRRTP